MDPWQLVVTELIHSIEQPDPELPDAVQEAEIDPGVFRLESTYLQLYLYHLMLGATQHKNVLEAYHAALVNRADYAALRQRFASYDRLINATPPPGFPTSQLADRMLWVAEDFARWCKSDDGAFKLWAAFYWKGFLTRFTPNVQNMVAEMTTILK